MHALRRARVGDRDPSNQYRDHSGNRDNRDLHDFCDFRRQCDYRDYDYYRNHSGWHEHCDYRDHFSWHNHCDCHDHDARCAAKIRQVRTLPAGTLLFARVPA